MGATALGPVHTLVPTTVYTVGDAFLPRTKSTADGGDKKRDEENAVAKLRDRRSARAG